MIYKEILLKFEKTLSHTYETYTADFGRIGLVL